MTWTIWFCATLAFPFIAGLLLRSTHPDLARYAFRFAPHFVVGGIASGVALLNREHLSNLRIAVQFAVLVGLWIFAVTASRIHDTRIARARAQPNALP